MADLSTSGPAHGPATRATSDTPARTSERWFDSDRGAGVDARHDRAVQLTADAAIANAHAWFEVNSGWAPPDEDTLAEWVDDGVCRCPDECMVEPEAWCDHGLASWWLILRALG